MSDLKTGTPLNLPYSDESEFIYVHNREFNITICVKKLQPGENNNDLINRINIEINQRFDRFESAVKEWNRFNSLSIKQKEKEIIADYTRWRGKKSFTYLTKSEKKELIDDMILYKLKIPVL